MNKLGKIFLIIGTVFYGLLFWTGVALIPLAVHIIALVMLSKGSIPLPLCFVLYFFNLFAAIFFLYDKKDEYKTIAKVFIIIGIVMGFSAIYPIILGIFALNKMSDGTMDTKWAVITTMFTSQLGGMFLLLDKINEKNNVEATAE